MRAFDTLVHEHDPLEAYFVGDFDVVIAEQGARVCVWEAEHDGRFDAEFMVEDLMVVLFMAGLLS